MQLTTREAVEMALYALAYSAENDSITSSGDRRAAELLCEHYGFKLEQFFDVEVVE